MIFCSSGSLPSAREIFRNICPIYTDPRTPRDRKLAGCFMKWDPTLWLHSRLIGWDGQIGIFILLLGLEARETEKQRTERFGPSVKLWLAFLWCDSWDAEAASQQKEWTMSWIYRKGQRWEIKILQRFPIAFQIWVFSLPEAHSCPLGFMTIQIKSLFFLKWFLSLPPTQTEAIITLLYFFNFNMHHQFE